ncbi:TetR/AcrR family transcriptional regulator [Kitasatospora azatica]|uniref:TetR/AcrR family transcriptional regulator n=1 Tax=Kitasatospora azatica TaxID=58347 RepID=UPI00055F8A9E|nr:TetR/AcrR family transcriptional regulator C-terminal domain-containing protein [Kitasatospora azatica]
MGRPSKALLDRERIGATALALVDAQGDFSVPQIAQRLGVQTASVYHHVQGRAGIIELLRVRIAEAVDASTLDLRPWDRAVEAFARSYRAAFAAHPRAIPLLTMSQVAAPEALAVYERAVGLLIEAGVPEETVMPVITALDNLVLGSALDLAAPEAMWQPASDGSTPLLARALAAVSSGRRTDVAFELALTALLTHVRELAAAEPEGPGTTGG